MYVSIYFKSVKSGYSIQLIALKWGTASFSSPDPSILVEVHVSLTRLRPGKADF